MLISEDYRALNATLHKDDYQFGMSGQKWAQPVHEFAIQLGAATVLDYGAGKGTLRVALGNVGYDIREYDPSVPHMSATPLPADLVTCTDVLEHIEPENIDDVLDDLARLAKVAVFLVISTRKAGRILADGRNAHLIVEPADWWIPKLLARWKVGMLAVPVKGPLVALMKRK